MAGAEIFGVAGVGTGLGIGCFLETFGTEGFEGGGTIFGIWRFSVDSRFDGSWVLGEVVTFSGFVNGVTLLNDGIVGAGLTAGRTFSTGAGVGGDGAGSGAGVCLAGAVDCGFTNDGVFMGGAGCNRLGRAMVGGAEGKRRLSIKGA